jgi:hypothetical protein
MVPVSSDHGGSHRMQMAREAVCCAWHSGMGLTRVKREREVFIQTGRGGMVMSVIVGVQ